jgi:integrase/recombinase XerD
MSDLRASLQEYLSTRRALGWTLHQTGKTLQRFVDFAQREGASSITTDLALRWARRPAGVDPSTCSIRLGMVRGFARFCSAADPLTEVPPDGLLPYRYRRKPPFLYSRADVTRLIAAAKTLRSPRGLRAKTFVTLIGLHAITGLRTGESVGLDRKDVDLERRLLWIRKTKFGKSRWVPIHSSTAGVLRDYAHDRDRTFPLLQTPAFFVTEKGKRLQAWAARATFAKLARRVGLTPPAGSRGPRLHDFRHSFAVATLLRWYRSGADVEQRMPLLATYLGHTNAAHTYWYLSATPELLRYAARLIDAPAGGHSR